MGLVFPVCVMKLVLPMVPKRRGSGMRGERIKRGEGLGRNLAKGRNYGRVGGRNPRTKRCYAYNILHFRLFLPYRRPCRFVFFLAGCGLMGLRRRGGRHAGDKDVQRCGEKPYRPYLSADGIGRWHRFMVRQGISTEKTTANGERYNMYAMTAAHKLLPLGTKVRVTHLKNGKSIVVRVNDRGPFVGDRIIDLSYAGARHWA